MTWRVVSWCLIVVFVVIVITSGMVFGNDIGHDGVDHSFVIRSVGRYVVPDVTLIDQDSQRIQLEQALSAPKPALVEFFFTTCTTFCDLRAARLLAVQNELAKDNIEIDFFSISTDPEFDTPTRLRSYAGRFRPVPRNWSLLTGTVSEIKQVETSFEAQNPSADKMLHQPLTFIQPRPGTEWIRLEGMMSNVALAEHVRQVIARSYARVSSQH